jgi:hypothetical protein
MAPVAVNGPTIEAVERGEAPFVAEQQGRARRYFQAPTTGVRLLALTDGAVIIGVALAMVIVGGRRIVHEQQRPNPFTGTGPDEIADAGSIVLWGLMVFTVGAYLCRAACRTDWAVPEHRRDLVLGYTQIVLGYGILGLTLHLSAHRAVTLWAAHTEAEGNGVLASTLGTFLVGGFAAALLIRLGTGRAHETVITTATVTVGW